MSVRRDAAVVAFLVTASGLTLYGIGSAFWGLIAGGVCYVVLNLIADRNRYKKAPSNDGASGTTFVNVKHGGIGRHVINNLFNIFESHWRTFVIQVFTFALTNDFDNRFISRCINQLTFKNTSEYPWYGGL